jgi:hypothetical protein
MSGWARATRFLAAGSVIGAEFGGEAFAASSGGLRGDVPGWLRSSGEGGIDGRDHDQGAAMAFGGHVHREIGGCQILGVALMGAPLHQKAVGQAPEQAQHRHAVGVADAAAVVVVRNIQPLVQAVFNAPKAGAVELQPQGSIQALGRGAGQQGDRFGFAPGGLAAYPGDLRGGREADGFGGGRGRAEDAGFIPAAIAFLSADAGAGRFLRGERLPEFPAAAV